MDPVLPPIWANRPPSPPNAGDEDIRPRLPGSTSSHSSHSSDPPPLSLSALSLRIGQPIGDPLPTPGTTSPRPHTPPGHTSGSGSTSNGLGTSVLSPPTPAPSPSPRNRSWEDEALRAGGGEVQHIQGLQRGPPVDEEERVAIDELGMGRKGKRRELERLDQLDPADVFRQFQHLDKKGRYAFLHMVIGDLSQSEALVTTRKIEPRLRRDFLRELPAELALHALSYVDDAKTLARACQVSRYWSGLLQDERTWKDMCERHRFTAIQSPMNNRHPQLPRRDTLIGGAGSSDSSSRRPSATPPLFTPSSSSRRRSYGADQPIPHPGDLSFRDQFKNAYLTESNWLHGGRVLACHTSHDDGVVTSLGFDGDYLIIGMGNAAIHIFDTNTATYRRSLVGHDLGVWTLTLVTPPSRISQSQSAGLGADSRLPKARVSYRDDGLSRRSSFNTSSTDPFGSTGAPVQSPSQPPSAGFSSISRPNTAIGSSTVRPPGNADNRPRSRRMVQSDVCSAARGWGNKRHLVVSGGCDRLVKVWDVVTGECVHTLRGHSSTVRCLKVLDGRPIAVSGSRDWTLRVWDIEKGRSLRTLVGHEQSVRCMEIAGNQVVSGSYDYTCRLWDVDTGQCLQVLRGHYHQIYAVAFDGERIVTGSLDSTVRVWSAATGECTALLQGHTSLVGQLQLSGDHLVTGGSDGRVIIFNLETNSCVHRLCAHDNSVTCIQFDDRFIVSSGNDGRVKLWDIRTGAFIRELTRPCEAVWRVAFRDDRCAILCQRDGRTVLEVISFRPNDMSGRRLSGSI